jgi:hypothetical protein
VLVAAEILGILDILRGDEVPAGAAATQVIQRGELAGDNEGFFVAGGRRRHEADPAGVLGNGGKQRHRLEHRGSVGRAVGGEQGGLVHLAHTIAVGQEHHVDAAALGDLRHLDHAF